jgi:hypothetical protein
MKKRSTYNPKTGRLTTFSETGRPTVLKSTLTEAQRKRLVEDAILEAAYGPAPQKTVHRESIRESAKPGDKILGAAVKANYSAVELLESVKRMGFTEAEAKVMLGLDETTFCGVPMSELLKP